VIYNVRNIQYNCSYIPDNLIDRSQDINTFSLLTQHSSFSRDYTRGLITSDASGQYAPTPTRMCRCSRRIERSDVFAKRRPFQRALRRTCVNLRECACAYSARGRNSRRVRRSGASELHVETRANHLNAFSVFYLQMHETSREPFCHPRLVFCTRTAQFSQSEH